MVSWLIVGLIVAIAAWAIIFRSVRLRSKRNREAPVRLTGEGGAPSSGAVATERSSGRGSAARWLSSLVKAGDSDRANRGDGA